MVRAKHDAGLNMTTILEREFCRCFRGPEIGAEDDWSLVFDPSTPRLLVRHRWRGDRHGGTDEYSLEEFLAQPSAARDALISLFFGRTSADAAGPAISRAA
jgi:hypothetical protein